MNSRPQLERGALLACGVAFVLILVHPLTGHAQSDDKAGANGDDTALSAGTAQNARERFDVTFGYVDQPVIDQAILESTYTRIIGVHHQLTAVVPLIDADIDSDDGLRVGDLRAAYNFTPKHRLSANPWVPSDVGTGIGLSIPTGDFDQGTGSGSWLLAPRLGLVKKLARSFAITPSLQYLFSFEEEDNAPAIRVLALSAPVVYVGPRVFWVQWTPAYIYNIELDDRAFGNTIRLGKLFKRHFAMSIDYTRTPVYAVFPGGSTTDYANQLTLGIHVPFGYGNTR